jgi:hypothetical protein
MELEAAFVQKLSAEPTITTIIGNRIAASVLPDRLARPNIVYQRIGTGRQYSNDGPAGIARASLQVSCYADDYSQARQLASAIRGVFNGFNGMIGTLRIQSMLLDDERDAPTPPPPGQSAGVVGIVMMFLVAYSE